MSKFLINNSRLRKRNKDKKSSLLIKAHLVWVKITCPSLLKFNRRHHIRTTKLFSTKNKKSMISSQLWKAVIIQCLGKLPKLMWSKITGLTRRWQIWKDSRQTNYSSKINLFSKVPLTTQTEILLPEASVKSSEVSPDPMPLQFFLATRVVIKSTRF